MSTLYTYEEWEEYIKKNNINTRKKYIKFCNNNDKLPNDPEHYYHIRAALGLYLWDIFYPNISHYDIWVIKDDIMYKKLLKDNLVIY